MFGCNLNQQKPTIYRVEIEQIKALKFLRLILVNRLNFIDHNNYVKEKLLKIRLRLFFTRTQLLRIFKIYVEPIVQFNMLIKWILSNYLETLIQVNRANTSPQFDKQGLRVTCFWNIQTTSKTNKKSTSMRSLFNHTSELGP